MSASGVCVLSTRSWCCGDNDSLRIRCAQPALWVGGTRATNGRPYGNCTWPDSPADERPDEPLSHRTAFADSSPMKGSLSSTRMYYAEAVNSIAKWVSRGSKTLRGCRAAPCRGGGAAPLPGSRDSVPGGCRVAPCWGAGAAPLVSLPTADRSRGRFRCPRRRQLRRCRCT